MRDSFFRLMTACLLLSAVPGARAGLLSGLGDDYARVQAAGRVSHLFDIDNDTLLLNDSDGFYTSGLRYTRSATLDSGGTATTYGWRIGQEQYTPSDIKLPAALVRPSDHPYAAWLYGGFFKEVRRADGTYTRLGIDIGCLGPCAGGEWTQTRFHRLLNQPLPQGWSRQVRNEVGVVLHAETAPVRWTPHPSFDLTPIFNARFGNIFTDAGAGLVARAGQLNLSPAGSALHAYLRTEVRAVGYNATLQGGYFSKNNPHTVAPKRLLGIAEAGIAWTRGAFGVKAAVIRRSNEIKDLPNSIGAQNYLQLQFSYTP
ncbi:MAG TPA: lipid A deacylase LpxR family protein [Noviherbaspirillum sp.]|uniref:lipid A deacylase LpxR family protein n=1 Tax=Noviherbaspirillum sp. TaxID=1926288 RepID=UPI002D5C9016|nr:lipid A deacylase LpxR family protein [Noviherbaspirillum sp.]HYD97074.1 lipid A deacylase LpxR family protein [Noviherbaspirillum sp.]